MKDSKDSKRALNMIFSIANYLELHNCYIGLLLMGFFDQVKLLLFCNIQTIESTFFSEI